MPAISLHNVDLNYPVFSNSDLGASRKPDNEGAVSSGIARHAGALSALRGTSPDSIKALSDVSFALQPGDRLGLIGRNGSGKSTLLRVLAGVYEPSGGSVEIDGKVAPLFSVGLGVRREATGRRNIVLRGLMNGLTRREAEAKIDEITEFSELGPFIDMPVRTYSSGMAMRLSFAMATAFSPEILLLDEWIGAGDENFQKKAAKRMHELVADSGITVMASHRRQVITRVCNVGLWLDGGVQRAFGPIDDVLALMEADEGP